MAIADAAVYHHTHRAPAGPATQIAASTNTLAIHANQTIAYTQRINGLLYIN